MASSLRRLRLRAVWLIVLPFFWLSEPSLRGILIGLWPALLGLWIRGWSAGTIQKDRELTTSGPYAHVRNPLYLGSLFLGLGVSMAGGHWIWPLVFLLFYLAVYTRTMTRETRVLYELFPDRYPKYLAEVPGFVPRLTPYRATAREDVQGFRWSRYGRNREWEAALGTVAAFGLLIAKAMWW